LTKSEYVQLLQDIRDGDRLYGHLKFSFPSSRSKPRDAQIQLEMDELAADLSQMRGLKHHYELKAMAEVTGASMPEYDTAAITRPLGEAIRARFEEVRGAA